VGYFKKQGFSSTITLNEQVYTGYIKDYDGATLMQCSLYTQVTYTRLTETLSLIKESLNVIRTHRYNQIKQVHSDAKFLPNTITTIDLNNYPDLIHNANHNHTSLTNHNNNNILSFEGKLISENSDSKLLFDLNHLKYLKVISYKIPQRITGTITSHFISYNPIKKLRVY